MKPFTSIEDQISILKKRKLTIPNEEAAKFLLKRYGYYNIINAFKDVFIINKNTIYEQFKKGTTFNEIYSLFCFDKKIRILFLEYILKIESSIKTIISYNFSKNYGVCNFLNINNFNPTPAKISPQSVIDNINNTLNDKIKNKDKMIIHYLNIHKHIPCWVLFNILSFGQISQFFRIMKIAERIDIAKELSDMFDKKIYVNHLDNYLTNLSLVRNICAHDQRLYTFNTRFGISKNNEIHNKYHFFNSTNDLFAIIIIMYHFLSKDDFMIFSSDFINHITALEKQLGTISIEDIKNIMGLEKHWDNFLAFDVHS